MGPSWYLGSLTLWLATFDLVTAGAWFHTDKTKCSGRALQILRPDPPVKSGHWHRAILATRVVLCPSGHSSLLLRAAWLCSGKWPIWRDTKFGLTPVVLKWVSSTVCAPWGWCGHRTACWNIGSRAFHFHKYSFTIKLMSAGSPLPGCIKTSANSFENNFVFLCSFQFFHIMNNDTVLIFFSTFYNFSGYFLRVSWWIWMDGWKVDTCVKSFFF